MKKQVHLFIYLFSFVTSNFHFFNEQPCLDPHVDRPLDLFLDPFLIPNVGPLFLF